MNKQFDNMIKIENLSKIFDRRVRKKTFKNLKVTKSSKLLSKNETFFAINNFNCKVAKGEIVGILGPNGAGKTTLLRMIGGILSPTTGNILINGYNTKIDMFNVKKNIGYISDNTKLYGKLTPRELLKFFGKLYGMNSEEINISINKIVKIIDINDFIDNKIEKLSTGQKQRTSIARCLIHSPEVYIFDEPTLGLDVLSSRSIINFMKSERNNNKTILYSTHYMEEAETICDRIVMIYKGSILAEGTSEELKKLTKTTNLRDAFVKLLDDGGETIEI